MKRAMKKSGVPWLGDVPAEWEVDKIKYWFEATNTRGNDNLQLLAATQKFGMYPQSKLEGVVQVAEKTDLNTFKTVHVDDFVISLRSFQGGLERSDYEGVCSPAYQTFHATRQIDTGYFKYLFKSPGFIQAINLLTVGIREGKTINYSDVRNLSIPFPPLPEQRRIAAFLDAVVAKIDGIRDGIQREIERLDDYRKSLVAETVCRGVRGTNRAHKPSGIPWLGDVPAEWDVVRMGWIAERKDPEYAPQEELLSVFLDRGVIRFAEGGEKRANVTSNDLSKYQLVVPGNLVMNNQQSWRGSVGVSDYRGIVSPAYIILSLDQSLNRRYANYFFRAIPIVALYEQCSHGVGSIQRNLAWDELRVEHIAIPPIPEQREIAAYLDKATAQIDAAVEARKGQLEKLDILKKTTIAEYTTGKKEVLT